MVLLENLTLRMKIFFCTWSMLNYVYLTANDIANEKKVVILLSVVNDAKAYELTVTCLLQGEDV